MAALFEAYITNLGKYNEGELVGETLKFPTTTEEVQGLLKRIGVDGVRYEEFFITSFDGDVLGLYDYLTEYENLDELNHLACLLSELDQGDLEKFEAVIDSGEHTSSVADLINLAQNLDCYEFYPGVEDDETLGRIYVEDMEAIDVPEHLLNYFDYEAYGRDIRLEEDGHFAPGGYVLNNGGQFIEHYHGIEDIPAEHKVFAFPQLTVREQMAAYKEIIDVPPGGLSEDCRKGTRGTITALLDVLSRGALFMERRIRLIDEDVSRRTIAVSIKATKLTGRVLAQACLAVGRKIKKTYRARQTPHGKQTVRQLMGHGAATNSIEVESPKDFDRVARKWNVDYAFYKTGPDKYLLFFKSGQADAITACFSEYSRRVMKRSKSRRVPIREQLKRAAAELARQPSHKKERAREAVHEDR